MTMKTALTLAVGLAVSAGSSAMSSKPKSDPIGDFQSSWAGKALAMQRDLDIHEPLSENSILGTHNSYNSEVYRNATRYHDPQQKHSIYDQLRMGARFLELDAHWTYKIKGFDWGTDVLLCHSGIGKSIGDVHVGCSLTDRRLTEGLEEVRNWLNENPTEVIILYIEDHVDGEHGKLWDALNSKLGNKFYASNGCKAIPNDLSEADVLQAGKQVVLFKDGSCANNSSLANTAFTGLGGISRIWEDRTGIGALGEFFAGKAVNRIEAADVTREFKEGRNIVNLDDMTYNDGRIEAAIWSWDKNEPNNHGGNQDCAVQWGNGRWDDAYCTDQHYFACENQNDGSWSLSTYKGEWTQGEAACAALGGDYKFSVPTSSKDNENLKTAKGGNSHVWLNYNDRQVEGNWQNPKGKGIFRELRDARANLCLDVEGGHNNNGQNVRMWNCNGSNAQKWAYDASTGFLRNIMGKCLDISGNDDRVREGQTVQLWDCHTSAKDQTWNFSGGVLRNRVNTNMVMDAYGSGSGADAGLWSYHGGNNQKWNWGN
ncbi:phosphatidylinositol-specific phospholipase C domain-containing protein [Bacterioplanoides sp.]|uniref:phosphatidylinositol-specific phospholipase C domain-containing protein n=1 Tax=Bacterioplanoides sp. TaxID=2066072 RepID=UPI003B58BAE9